MDPIMKRAHIAAAALVWDAERLTDGVWTSCACSCHKKGPLDPGEGHEDREHDDDRCRGWHRIRERTQRWYGDGAPSS